MDNAIGFFTRYPLKNNSRDRDNSVIQLLNNLRQDYTCTEPPPLGFPVALSRSGRGRGMDIFWDYTMNGILGSLAK